MKELWDGKKGKLTSREVDVLVSGEAFQQNDKNPPKSYYLQFHSQFDIHFFSKIKVRIGKKIFMLCFLFFLFFNFSFHSTSNNELTLTLRASLLEWIIAWMSSSKPFASLSRIYKFIFSFDTSGNLNLSKSNNNKKIETSEKKEKKN